MTAEKKSWRDVFRPPEDAREPDVLVGIDIGTSFTKVAYTIYRNGKYERIRVCQNWSKFGYKNGDTNFLPTVLAFPKNRSLLDELPKQCGNLTKELRENKSLEVYEWFKKDFPGNLRVRLSSGNPDRRTTQVSSHSVENANSTDTMILYRHFLTWLYQAVREEIKVELEKDGPCSWEDAHIEFIFSIPATWNRIDETLGRIASKLERVAKTAGFGEIKGHSVKVGLTEPEAAAACSLAVSPPTSRRYIDSLEFHKESHNILVVDAGGGTTDLCLINVHNAHVGKLSIDTMSAPVGENVGSSHIDRMFEELAEDRLRNLSYELKPPQEWELDQLSYAMRHDEGFEASKEALDSKQAVSSALFTVSGPDLSMYQGKDVSPWVQNGRIRFDFRELAGLFDSVIDDTTGIIDGHRETLPGINKLIHSARKQIRDQQRTPASDIDIILLSGGLGQSKYLKHRVEQALEKDQDVGTQTPRVVTMDEPRLSVCKGLLHNRMGEIFMAQKCNGNYGILQLTKFNTLNPRHYVAKVANQTTKLGNKTFVNDMKWLVMKGDTIPKAPPKYLYTFEQEGDKVVNIVVSADDKPKNFSNSGRDSVAEVRCDLGELAEDTKSKKKYCEVELIFNIGKFDVKCCRGLACMQSSSGSPSRT
ncbi:HSP70 family protein [Apiospora sp. TS-2023a]